MAKVRRSVSALARCVALASFGTLLLAGVPSAAVSAAIPAQMPAAQRAERCPWTTAAAAAHSSPSVLADEVLGRMTSYEKVHFVDLASGFGYENHNAGVPRLCIPMLTLEDGPNGIAYNTHGVTQLPASLGLAATFDPQLARSYGAVIGRDARNQGVDVVQGPNLNLDRVPTSGRAFEAYGEDPYLTSVIGVADIEGIQSAHVMAEAKHFTAYTQETDRLHLDQSVSERALQELYLPPFRAAVEEGHVASVMCAYGQINGNYVCQDPGMFRILKQDWHFRGFVRSDLGAVLDPVSAFDAGLDAVKPAAPQRLLSAVDDGALPMSRLDDAVRRMLTMMFAYGIVEHPPAGQPNTIVTDPNATAVSLATAEQSTVLLKNDHGALPLDPSHDRSVAVIGPDAAAAPATAGFGSAHVLAPHVVTPLAALTAALGKGVTVGYVPGGPRLAAPLPRLGMRLAFTRVSGHGRNSRAFVPAATRGVSPLSPGYDTAQLNSTASEPGSGNGWLEESRTFSPSASGLYSMSVTDAGDSFVYLGHSLIYADRGVHGRSSWTTPIRLSSTPTTVRLRWFARPGYAPPSIGLAPVGGLIDRAVALAKASSVAVVFADDYSSEGVDRPNLSLPGDENALITAVAAANPRTIVVLNTGGPVLMPWLRKVAAVVESWYPGQIDGSAVAAVLTGAVDPSGHLPVTFPERGGSAGLQSTATWPGIGGRVEFGGSLAIGYRFEDEMRLQPLFPFGYGLSYTTFSLSRPSVAASSHGAVATVTVTNTGARAGRALVQGYLNFPASAGEPPEQLATFGSADLAPGKSTTLRLPVTGRAFEAYLGGHFQAVPGNYTLSLGWSSRDLPVALTLTAPGIAPAASGAHGPAVLGP